MARPASRGPLADYAARPFLKVAPRCPACAGLSAAPPNRRHVDACASRRTSSPPARPATTAPAPVERARRAAAIGARVETPPRPGLGQRRQARDPAHPRRRRLSLSRRRRQADPQGRGAASGSAPSRSRRPTRTSGSARARTATCRPPGATRAAASSTAITPTGGSRATPTSSSACSSSARRCRASGSASPADLAAPVGAQPRARDGAGDARPAARHDPACGSATTNTRAPTARSA